MSYRDLELTNIVEALDRIGTDDPESAHAHADGLLVQALEVFGDENGARVVAAYRRLQERSPWWARHDWRARMRRPGD